MHDRNSIKLALTTTTDIQTARIAQFMVSMGPSYAALEKGHLDSLRPFKAEEKGILYGSVSFFWVQLNQMAFGLVLVIKN